MLKVAKQRTVTATQSVALDACGGSVMLSLSDGEGHVFRQALDAHDVGKILALIATGGCDDASYLCQGDLVAKVASDEHEGLHFAWHDERGGDGLVRLDCPGEMVLEEALRSYCRLLMRSQEALP